MAMNKQRILIIDDDRQLNAMLESGLSQHGYETASVTDGMKGLAAAAANPPDLVICDLDMPVMNGLEVIAGLRRQEDFHDTPVVFLSACGDRQQVRQSMNLGGDDFLSKPAALGEVLAAVAARLRLRAQKRKKDLHRFQKTAEIFSGIFNDLAELPAAVMETLAIAGRPAAVDRPTAPPALADANANPSSAILAKNNGRKVLLRLSEVKVIQAQSEYSVAYWGKDQHMMLRKPLKQWQTELPAHLFVRVHRNTLINLKYLEALETAPDGQLNVQIRGFKRPILVSQRAKARLNLQLKKYAATLNDDPV